MPELPLTLAEAAQWLRGGRLTSVKLTEAMLARSQAMQDTVAAFITLNEESALAAARRADADFARGIIRSPLQGIPLATKDIIATADAPTTANSLVLDRKWGEGHDATVIRKLREAGAVITGKLALHEYATGWPDPATGFPIPKNPWDLSRTPGGSSSGTGAAIAAGLIFGGLGTDTGGSIRGPAAFSGISGLKPTFGRVSKEGCVPLSWSLDHIGPLARTARDCALMLQVMAGYDPADPCSANTPVPDMTVGLDGSLAGIRIGLPRDPFFTVAALDAEVKAAVLAAIDQMAAAGAKVVEVQIPHADLARAVYTATMLAESYAYHEPDLRERPDLYGKHTRDTLLHGVLVTGADYVNAQRARTLLKAECAQALADVDVLVMPTMLSTASPFDRFDPDARFTRPGLTNIWNLTGFPALSVNCGFSSAGLPIGLQIVGKPFDEPTVLKVGDAYQQITDWHTRVPDLLKEERFA